jgi:hypothetical protein
MDLVELGLAPRELVVLACGQELSTDACSSSSALSLSRGRGDGCCDLGRWLVRSGGADLAYDLQFKWARVVCVDVWREEMQCMVGGKVIDFNGGAPIMCGAAARCRGGEVLWCSDGNLFGGGTTRRIGSARR